MREVLGAGIPGGRSASHNITFYEMTERKPQCVCIVHLMQYSLLTRQLIIHNATQGMRMRRPGVR